MINSGIFNCEVIYERIKEEGYTGGRTILRDYVRPFGPPKQVPAVRRFVFGFQKQIRGSHWILGTLDFTGAKGGTRTPTGVKPTRP